MYWVDYKDISAILEQEPDERLPERIEIEKIRTSRIVSTITVLYLIGYMSARLGLLLLKGCVGVVFGSRTFSD